MLTRSRRMSSGRFRAFLHTPLAAEWEKITGACDTSKARRAVASETWDKSTIMPKRFISATTFCEGRLGGRFQGTYMHALINQKRGMCICAECSIPQGPYFTKAGQSFDTAVE